MPALQSGGDQCASPVCRRRAITAISDLLPFQKGNIDKAVTALEKAVNFNKMFIQAYATLANAYLFQGLVDKSIEINLKALEIDANFPIAHNNLAICYLEKEEFDLAVEHCDKAVSMGYDVAPEILKEIAQYRK